MTFSRVETLCDRKGRDPELGGLIVEDSPVSFLFLLLVPVWANTRFAQTDIHLAFAFPVSFA